MNTILPSAFADFLRVVIETRWPSLTAMRSAGLTVSSTQTPVKIHDHK